MKKDRVLPLLFPFLLLCASSCTKTGPQGPAGGNGTNGADGDANVFTSTVTVESTEWAIGSYWMIATSQNQTQSLPTKYYDIPFDKITPGIIDSGLVSVYIAPSVPGQWLQLPYSFDDGAEYINFVYTVTAGNVRLQIYLVPTVANPTTDIYSYKPAQYNFKIVAAAGNL